jgi:hypothetical protein
MKFPRQLAAHDRIRHTDTTLVSVMRERDNVLAHAAEAANRSRAVRALEREFDKLEIEVLEPWDEAPSR